FVPDRHAALAQPVVVARTLQEPQQLVDDRLQVHLLRGDEREAFGQVEAHLLAEDAARARACAVRLGCAMRVDMAHEVFVLGADGARHAGNYVRTTRPGFMTFFGSSARLMARIIDSAAGSL